MWTCSYLVCIHFWLLFIEDALVSKTNKVQWEHKFQRSCYTTEHVFILMQFPSFSGTSTKAKSTRSIDTHVNNLQHVNYSTLQWSLIRLCGHWAQVLLSNISWKYYFDLSSVMEKQYSWQHHKKCVMEQAVSGNGVRLVTTNGPGQLYGLLLDLSAHSKVSLYKENFIKELAHCLNICSHCEQFNAEPSTG